MVVLYLLISDVSDFFAKPDSGQAFICSLILSTHDWNATTVGYRCKSSAMKASKNQLAIWDLQWWLLCICKLYSIHPWYAIQTCDIYFTYIKCTLLWGTHLLSTYQHTIGYIVLSWLLKKLAKNIFPETVITAQTCMWN